MPKAGSLSVPKRIRFAYALKKRRAVNGCRASSHMRAAKSTWTFGWRSRSRPTCPRSLARLKACTATKRVCGKPREHALELLDHRGEARASPSRRATSCPSGAARSSRRRRRRRRRARRCGRRRGSRARPASSQSGSKRGSSMKYGALADADEARGPCRSALRARPRRPRRRRGPRGAGARRSRPPRRRPAPCRRPSGSGPGWAPA